MASQLAELGLAAEALAILGQRGICTVRDFALEFYLGEQHPRLAQLLNVPLERARELITMAAKTLPSEELARLQDIARRVQTYPFGALPPKKSGERLP